MIKVTDQKTPNVESDSILIQEKYDAVPTPNGQLKSGVYYSWKGKWTDMWDKFVTRAQALIDTNLAKYVPITRTITINGDTKNLSADRSWTVSGGTQNLEGVLTEGNDGGALQIKNIADPTLAQDAATKAYVDASSTSPAGSDTQVQFNDGGSFGAEAAFTYDKTTNKLTVDLVHTSTVQAHTSAGLVIEATGGGDVALFGAGGGQNATFYDGVKLDASTASRILGTDGASTVGSLDTATYPSLTELSYVKGVTSDIQTQFGNKQDNIQKILISGSDITTTSNTAQNITGLVTGTLEINSTYIIECRIRLRCNNTGGVKIGATIPSGATLSLTIFGIGATNSLFISSTSGALSASAFNLGAFTSILWVFGRVTTGGASGSVQVQFASGTSGQTSTIYGSNDTYLTIMKS